MDTDTAVDSGGEPRRQTGRQVLRLDVVARGQKWRANFGTIILCVAASPMIHSARILLARGLDPSITIEMWHRAASEWSLRGKLAAVAAVAIEGELRKAREP
jgi:hypothetical protein